jgi:hypothetical protein
MGQSLHRFECLDAAHVLHGLYDDDPTDQESPTVLVGGNGAIVRDATGRRYLGGLSSPRNACLCHSRKELAEAAADQMRQQALERTYSGLANAPAIQLAARLKGIASEELTATFFITRSRKPCPLGRGGTHPRWGIKKGDGVLLYPTSGRVAATSTPDLALPFAFSEGQREERASILPQAVEDTTNGHW